MAYTIGIKKSILGFIPWTTKLRVTRHSWENFRFVFDLEGGSQLLVPGFKCEGVEVYPDFWDHVRLEKQRAESEKLAAAMKREEESRKALADAERQELEMLRQMEKARAMRNAAVDTVGTVGFTSSPTLRMTPEPTTELGRVVQDMPPQDYEVPPHVRPDILARAQERVNGLLSSSMDS